LNESKNWQKPTDTDRLFQAFDQLCQMNIIALHYAGYTSSDGEYEVVEVEEKLNEKGVSSLGYCFYHEQDLERAIELENPSLSIAFQKIDNEDDKVTIEVGKKIVSVLERNGFTVLWNESPTRKIEIPNFKWQKIYKDSDSDLINHDKVVKMMTNANNGLN
jgi:predicted MPP superfamily phosphohydrolase